MAALTFSAWRRVMLGFAPGLAILQIWSAYCLFIQYTQILAVKIKNPL